jgi:hypothetical protein
VVRGLRITIVCFFLSLRFRGPMPQRYAHGAKTGVEDILCWDVQQGAGSVSIVLSFSVIYISPPGEHAMNDSKSNNPSVCWRNSAPTSK